MGKQTPQTFKSSPYQPASPSGTSEQNNLATRSVVGVTNNPSWMCTCGFRNQPGNMVCGGTGPLGCKSPKPSNSSGGGNSSPVKAQQKRSTKSPHEEAAIAAEIEAMLLSLPWNAQNT